MASPKIDIRVSIREASWLGALKSELIGFPNLRHDDQVDSVTQALNWILNQRQKRISFVAPVIGTKPRQHFGDHPGY